MRLRFAVLTLLLAGLLSHKAVAGTLTVQLTTTPAGGNYAPRNVVAVWIEDAAGAFVKTIGRWSAARTQHLVSWRAGAGTADADAVSGATRQNHNAPLTVTWNGKNRAGVDVPDGTYKVRMELADRNSTTATQNNQGTFTFEKTPAGFTQSTAGGGFTNVSITYSQAAPTCDNGMVDAGETCDPPGSCPTSCQASADACMPNVLVGSAATCTAACVVQAVTDCGAEDGCCPAGCTAANDVDCAGGIDNGGGDLTGGCEVGGGGGGPGLLVLLLGVGLVVLRRPRAR
ncbi:MAG: DUF2271 domain-containing protein [Kofleriaceae bacterium]